MARRINARLDDELAARVDALQSVTGQSITEILKAALELYHDRLGQTARSPGDVLAETGFVGCSSGPRDLSVRYKGSLRRSLAKKT